MSKSFAPRTAQMTMSMLAIALITGLIVSGCGGGSSSSSSTQTASSSGSGSSDASSKGVEEAQAAIAEIRKPPTKFGITVPLKEKPTGATVAFMKCGVPECAAIDNSLEPAAKAMGVKLQSISIGNTPQTIADGFNTAIETHPDAVIVPATDPVIWQPQLKKLRAEGIPVLSWYLPENIKTDPVAEGILTNTYDTSNAQNVGKLMADFVVAESNGEAHVVDVEVPEYTIFKVQAEAFKEELEGVCPECSVESLKSHAEDIGTKIPGAVVSNLQQHPETNWVVFDFGSIESGVPQALAAAGLSEQAKLISASGESNNYEAIKNGEEFATLAVDLHYLAWQGIDAAGRAITGQSVAPDGPGNVPMQILKQEDINFEPSEEWVGIPGYEQKFEELWAGKTPAGN